MCFFPLSLLALQKKEGVVRGHVAVVKEAGFSQLLKDNSGLI